MLTFSSRNATRDRLHIFTTNYKSLVQKPEFSFYNAFNLSDVNDISQELQKLMDKLGKPDEQYLCNEDDPIEFEINQLAPYIRVLAQDSAASQYLEYMTIRIESLLKNTNILSVIGNEPQISLLEWIHHYLGNDDNKGKICVIDLSIVPTEIVHLVVAVVARLIFEALQRYRKHYGQELPTLMIMEEAHTFIKNIQRIIVSIHRMSCVQKYLKK